MKWLDKLKHIFTEDKGDTLKKEIDDINKSLKIIEDIIKDIKDKPLECHISIEELNVDKLHLENLVFNLDKIDIKELSGALNIGNNFGVTVGKEQKKKEKKNKADNLAKKIQVNLKDKQNKEDNKSTKNKPLINKRYTL